MHLNILSIYLISRSLYKIHRLLPEEWDPFYSNSEHRNEDFEAMDEKNRTMILAEFVSQAIPGWPSTLTLERFLLHMTTHHPTLVRTLLVWKHNHENATVPGYDILLNPDKSEQKARELQELHDEIEETFKLLDFSSERSQKIVLTILWFTGLPCKRLLKKCIWHGVTAPCSSLFQLVPTDVGFCCSFNNDPLRVTLKNSSFANIIDNIETRWARLHHDKLIIFTSPYAGLAARSRIALDAS